MHRWEDLEFIARALATVEALAREAGRVLLEGWDARPLVEYKSAEKDLVTEFDRRSEAIILAGLRQAFPDDAVIGEEGAAAAGTAEHGIFYVDPLDGTVNFAHGLPLFAVSIGLQWAGRPVLGVVHAPALSWTFTGAPGVGAFRDGRAIRPSAIDELDRALVVTGFLTAIPARARNTPSFQAFNQVAQGVRRLGAAALDLCFVGCGWMDGTWQRDLGPWDSTAGAAIVTAAGGTVSELDGGRFDPLTGGILASNGLIHQQMLQVLRDTP